MTAPRFKFAWSRTWQDQPYDFVARDGDLNIGRVYRIAGVEERWKWNMTAWLDKHAGSASGIVDSRDEACDAVEAAYEQFRAAVGQK